MGKDVRIDEEGHGDGGRHDLGEGLLLLLLETKHGNL